MNGEPDSSNPAGDVLKMAVWRNPLVWLTCFTLILVNGMLARFDANILQCRFVEVVLYCLQNGLPIRIICLKPRQRGISTITVGIMAWLLTRWPGRAIIIGRKGKQTDNLWRMLRRYHSEDSFPWGVGKPRITDEEATYANGSTVTKESSEGLDPGRSDTYQAILCTEVAYWGSDAKVKNASGVLAGLMACVKALAKTYVVLESTSAGPAGLFYRRWQEAVTFEEFKRDPIKHKGKFIRVFAGWHEFPDCCDELRDQAEAAEIMDGVGALNHDELLRERDLVRQYALTAGQVKWWRRVLTECDNDPAKRDLDYPGTPEDAFQAGQLCRFNWGGLKTLREEAHQALHDLQFGSFYRSHPGQRTPEWRPHGCSMEQGGDFCIAEHPAAGMRYVLSVDTAKGIQSGDDKRNLDCHAVMVIREGYFGVTGEWVRPRVVATITGQRRRVGGVLRMEARWEPYVLADRIKELADYYGNCVIVVENNNDPGVLPRLKHLGCHLYEEVYDEKDTRHSGQSKGKLGFTMGDNSDRNGVRSTIIADLAQAIAEVATRGMGIQIPFPWILDELQHFINDPDTGRAEAAEGWHDDWVMSLAIGRAVKGSAKTYIAPLVAHGMPGFMEAPKVLPTADQGFRV